MNFDLSEDEKMLRDMVGRFGDQLGARPFEADEVASLNASSIAQARDLGLLGLADDGADLGFAVVALYELAQRDAALAWFIGCHCAATAGIGRAGEPVGTYTIIMGDLTTDEVNGQAYLTGAASVFALDHCTSFVAPIRLSGKGALAYGSCHLFGETQPYRSLGLTALGMERVSMNALGVEHLGEDSSTEFARWLRVCTAAIASGIARAALDAGVRYASERQQFGKALTQFQATQFKIADMALQADAAWTMVQRAATTQAISIHRAALTCASQAALKNSDEALQLHGGYGYTREYLVERLYRDARAISAFDL